MFAAVWLCSGGGFSVTGSLLTENRFLSKGLSSSE